MAVPQAHFIHTEEEYLLLERAAEERHEYLDGYIFEVLSPSTEEFDRDQIRAIRPL